MIIEMQQKGSQGDIDSLRPNNIHSVILKVLNEHFFWFGVIYPSFHCTENEVFHYGFLQ